MEALLCVDWSCPLTDIVTTSADSCELLTLASSSCQAPALLFLAQEQSRIYAAPGASTLWLFAFACYAHPKATQLPPGR